MGEQLGEHAPSGRVMTNPADQPDFCTEVEGFYGIWHTQPSDEPPGSRKYSGGLGTYPAQQGPQAVYADAVRRTFFCYGGTTPGNHEMVINRVRRWDFQPGNLLHCVASFDHASKTLSKPTAVFDKWCADPHDNPVLQIDRNGYLWLFSPSHGDWTTRSFIHRSSRPYDHTSWETVADGPLYAYPQPHYDPDHGFLLLHTIYNADRGLHLKTSPDGRVWSNPCPIARAGQGHYAVSAYDSVRRRLFIAFDFHPLQGGLTRRTNFYFLQSSDWGQTWQASGGRDADLPVLTQDHPSRVFDFASQGLRCYLKDLVIDAAGEPIVLFSQSANDRLSTDPQPTCRWKLARRSAGRWSLYDVCSTDHDYDYGCLYVEADQDGEVLRLIGATEPGPQPGLTGGHLAVWTSRDRGVTWSRDRVITQDSPVNHGFPRRPLNAASDFYAFWADGDAETPSPSGFWYAGRDDTAPNAMPGAALERQLQRA